MIDHGTKTFLVFMCFYLILGCCSKVRMKTFIKSQLVDPVYSSCGKSTIYFNWFNYYYFYKLLLISTICSLDYFILKSFEIHSQNIFLIFIRKRNHIQYRWVYQRLKPIQPKSPIQAKMMPWNSFVWKWEVTLSLSRLEKRNAGFRHFWPRNSHSTQQVRPQKFTLCRLWWSWK